MHVMFSRYATHRLLQIEKKHHGSDASFLKEQLVEHLQSVTKHALLTSSSLLPSSSQLS